jgi:hypothetical protein
MRIDDEIGMAWWNALSDQDRAKWASLARTGRAKDAWELFKASTEMRNDLSEPSRRRRARQAEPRGVSICSADQQINSERAG